MRILSAHKVSLSDEIEKLIPCFISDYVGYFPRIDFPKVMFPGFVPICLFRPPGARGTFLLSTVTESSREALPFTLFPFSNQTLGILIKVLILVARAWY